MPVDTAAGLTDALRRHRLLEPAQLGEVDRLQTNFPSSRALAGELIRRGWLTPYQVNQLLQGRGRELLLGSYALLERIGEGGMGQVFKARNWKLGQVVALKLIRKQRIDNPDAVRRFQREIRAAAQLDHPNIVRAFDADEVGGTHLLVMEYVQGTDLSKLVKKAGPLPVDQACDYCRQAALGLQHACERGLVHRDIKPQNLLLTPAGVVKILDMGLARLDRRTDEEGSSTMTQEGAVMGTLDYIAPEQAMDSHDVDVRADLYSLGCTLYFLLTGKVPFPGGEALQKLLKHRLDEPVPVEQLRRDVPPGVASVVRKLMAKRPEDRYQTPAEAAAALASAAHGEGSTSATFLTAALPAPAPAAIEATVATAAGWSAMVADQTTVEGASPTRRRRTNGRSWGWIAIGSAVGVGMMGLGLTAMFLATPRPATPPAPAPPPAGVAPTPRGKAEAVAFDEWVKKTAALPADEQVEAVAAKLNERNPGFDGKLTPTVETGVVTGLEFLTDNVTDVSPVRALPGLTSLNCQGSADGMGRLSDLSPLKGMPLTSLKCGLTKVSELSALKGMPLTHLRCYGTPVSDLSPLKGMPLTWLHCASTRVLDLSPLKGMRLTLLEIDGTQVSDLSPLKGMSLTSLFCFNTPVSDLSPLKGMPLKGLVCTATHVSDFSPLKDLPLKELNCDFQPKRDAEILRSIKTLEQINGKPAADFWKEVDQRQAAFEVWCKEVPPLPAEGQVTAVAAKLKELNPGFDGTVKPTIENGVVTGLEFVTDQVTDISPVRALAGLRTLNCHGIWPNKLGRLADLSPLKEMKLTSLDCSITDVSDLTPLKDMKLTFLNCAGTHVIDLSPLKGVPLETLWCHFTGVSDLSPLKDMKLTILLCERTQVSDLSPLKDMKLTGLSCGGTQVSDLSPLKDMKLTGLRCGDTQVSDLSPLKGMPLTNVACNGTKVTDLSPLKGMPLKDLNCDFKPERDAELLRSIKTLEKINDKPAAEVLK